MSCNHPIKRSYNIPYRNISNTLLNHYSEVLKGAIKITQIGLPILKRMDKPVGKYFSKYSTYKTHIKNIVY
jgi:hypothetical protein